MSAAARIPVGQYFGFVNVKLAFGVIAGQLASKNELTVEIAAASMEPCAL